MNNLEKTVYLLKNSKNITVLSGAGMSTNAGIADFRGPNGIYTRADIDYPERIFDFEYFKKDPHLFYKFHREFLKTIENAVPTFTHEFLLKLEKEGKIKSIITQNIDSLHQKAGSEKVLEIHGGVINNYCIECHKFFSYEVLKEKLKSEDIPKCDCGGVIKPDIVFFGEMVKSLDQCQKQVQDSDLLIILGSSLTVTPAAFLPSYAGGKIIIVNKGDISFFYVPEKKLEVYENNDIDSFFKKISNLY
ncbi:NAD-dependent deacetylase [Oceanotoga teriensis]|uniref:protein acetyllysine N-acetyltransferase n=1 Tax=Oceanotoga teriensis TaxID=515440 RepID=A0AA45C8I9_9BACT|nr:Sir2 family NAD-dependent protein deacetylase [Oceanotoga teriensis]PWJ96160.1 NAD-dependent deacetylase [Oceanotoga teriensis]